jgi:hypothetical protein
VYVHFLLTECNKKTGNISFESVEHFIDLGITLKNQNYIHKKIKSRLNQKCLLSFGAESFAFWFDIQEYKD